MMIGFCGGVLKCRILEFKDLVEIAVRLHDGRW